MIPKSSNDHKINKDLDNQFNYIEIKLYDSQYFNKDAQLFLLLY